MTRQEAIAILKYEKSHDIFVCTEWRKKIHEALEMAISSLETDEAYQLEYERTTEEKYCDRNICASNDVNGIGCEDCEVTKSQERTTKNDLLHCQHTDEEIAKSFIEDVEAVKDLLPTTKNDLGVDAVSRQEVLDLIADYDLSMGQVVRGIHALPSVTTPQEPKTRHCRDCKWWKDSDGAYRRGIGAESKCPMNRREVFEGNGYCYLYEPQESEDKE